MDQIIGLKFRKRHQYDIIQISEEISLLYSIYHKIQVQITVDIVLYWILQLKGIPFKTEI